MIFLPLFRLFVAAVYQNVDNFALAAAYRIKNVAIPWRSNLLIGICSGLATGVAVISGYTSGQGIDAKAERLGFGSVAERSGRGILIMIGVWILVGYFRSKLFGQLGNRAGTTRRGTGSSDRINATPIARMRGGESFVAAIALAADNLAPSFFLGWAGLIRNNVAFSAVVLSGLTTACSLMAVALGQAAGRKGRAQLHCIPAELVSGCLIIGIALLDSDGLMRDLTGR